MLVDDIGLQPTRHALAEHHEIEELVEGLQRLDPADEAWLDSAKQLDQ